MRESITIITPECSYEVTRSKYQLMEPPLQAVAIYYKGDHEEVTKLFGHIVDIVERANGPS